jgi:MATE family multidrug resistance protein
MRLHDAISFFLFPAFTPYTLHQKFAHSQFFPYLCSMKLPSLNSQILRLAIPSILANITIPLVGLVDTAIVGHIANATAIGGIAIGTMLFDLLYWNFGFLRVGTSGMTAQAFGRGDRVECARLLSQSIGIALIGAALIWLIQWLFVNLVLTLVPCSTEVANFAREYFFIRIWAAPATLSLMAFKGWFIGMQDTVSPMITDILVNVVNMAVSYVLAVYTPMGALGVALGTVIAQFTGLTAAIILLIAKYRQLWQGLSPVRLAFDGQGMRRLLSLNGNLFVRSLCFMVVYVGFTSLASNYGDVELAVSTIMMKLFMLFSYFVDGFAYAGEALVGKYIGWNQDSGVRSHDKSDISRVVRLLFAWSLGVGVIFTLLFALWSGGFYRGMTSDTTVLSRLTDYTAWLIAMPIVSTLAFMWDGVYAGATAGKHIRNAMIYAAIAFVMSYLATYLYLDVVSIYIAYFAHLAARVLYLTFAWKKVEEAE